jgi:tetratricopeptide (TPR) repeat protein/tRNA A-37 threonylcarbamoyl transferase component Bud32
MRAAPAPGAVLADRYRIERELGQGGMATVYLAHDLKHGRNVAIKVLRPELAAVLGGARFLQEIRISAQLDHPLILTLIDSGEANGMLYYVLPYVRGESLRHKLTRERQLSLEEALAITRQVASALDYAHGRGVIHRDIKPENILLHEGEAVVADFGIALAVREAGGERFTESGIRLGTPQYMSPEQATGDRALDARSDVYALGAVLYEMLTGEPPHSGSTAQAILAKVLTERPTPIRTLRDTVPEPVALTAERALAKTPADRFPSAAAFVKELTIPSHPSTRRALTRPSLKTLVWLLGGLALLVAGVALRGTLTRNRPPRGIDPRRSLLIGFFDNTRRDASLEWLRLGGVELLSRSLARWQDLDVVPPERLLDLTRGARLSETAPMTQAEALRLAREAGVWTASVGSILPERDSIQITLRLYDVASGRQLRQVSVAAAGDSALPAAFMALANQIFDLARVPDAALIEADPPTRSIVAWKAYAGGLHYFTHLQFDSAVVLFHQARLADPRFALAYQQEAVQLMGKSGPFGADTMVVALADSAWKYSAGRPDKERFYIEGFWHLVHGRFPEARAAYSDLLSRDSAHADVWTWAGIAARNDLTMRRGADGRQIFPADPTFAIRAYRRAIALNRNDPNPYFLLTLTLSELADSGSQVVPSFAQPPTSFFRRFPRDTVRRYRYMLIHDSVAIWPVDSFKATPAQVQASLTAAETALHDLVERWVSIVPDNPGAWWWWARAAERERRWDDALTGYTRATRLGYGGTAYDRLGVLLGAHRLSAAGRLADSLDPDSALLVHPGRGFAFPAAALATAWMAEGRVAEAQGLWRRLLLEEIRARGSSAEGTEKPAADPVSQMTPAIYAERATPADLHGVRPRLTESTFAPLGLLAAQLGDTASLRRWRAETGLLHGYAGVDAWARARKGDRAGAAQALVEFDRDHAPSWLGNYFAAGRAAELLGQSQRALGFYAKVDSSSLNIGGRADPGWILQVRAWKVQADVCRTIGDTANARIFYRRVIETWVRPDALLVPERDDASRRLAELERTDRRDH